MGRAEVRGRVWDWDWFGLVGGRGEGDVLLVFFFRVDVVGEYSRGFES